MTLTIAPDQIDPTLDWRAMSADESAHPELWRGLVGAWVPALGNQGANIGNLSRNNNVTITENGGWTADWVAGGLDVQQSGARDNSGGFVLDQTLTVTLPYTFVAWINATNYQHDSNAGFWRTDSNGTGPDFNIIDGNDNSPWIRVGETDVLNPSGGTVFPTPPVEFVTAYSVTVSDAAWYLNGAKEHSASHSATAGSDIFRFGWQAFTDECIEGTWKAWYWWGRQLTEAEHRLLYIDPLAPFRLSDDTALRAAITATGGGVTAGNANMIGAAF